MGQQNEILIYKWKNLSFFFIFFMLSSSVDSFITNSLTRLINLNRLGEILGRSKAKQKTQNHLYGVKER